MSFTVLVTAATLSKSGADLLAQVGARVIYLSASESVEELERLMGTEPVEAVISRTVRLTAKAIETCPTLKVISKHGVGVSNIDVEAATRRGIPVYVTPGANAQSVAELTLGLMFAAARRIGWMDKELHEGRWSRAQDGIELQGKTLGLIGFGQVGRRVAAFCQVLGMHVVAYDPALIDGVSPLPGVRILSSLNELLSSSHVVSLHAPLNKYTCNMLGAAQFAAMPRGAILVNTARGEVVDESALIAALKSGQLYAAGLDTMAVEPLPLGSELATLPNVVLTPHVGGSTPAALSGMASGAARNVLNFLQGTPVEVSACVNPHVLSPT